MALSASADSRAPRPRAQGKLDTVEAVKRKEEAIAALVNQLAKDSNAEAVKALLVELRPLFGAIPKAKTAKARAWAPLQISRDWMAPVRAQHILARASIDPCLQMPSPRTQLVRVIIDTLAQIPGTTQLQMQLCNEQVEWCRAEKRTFLRQRIQIRLAALLLETREYTKALALIAELLTEASGAARPLM